MSASEPKSTASLSEVMRDLELCERDIQALVRLAEETVNEMQRLPNSNAGKIEQLSETYLSKLKSVQEKLKIHSSVLLVPAVALVDAEVQLAKSQREIAEARRLLEEN